MPAPISRRAASIGSALALALPAVAWADPLPVHTPTSQVSARPTTLQRIAVADAVAAVFAATLPDVLTGAESHTRVETLTPASLSCAEARCAGAIRTALGARAVVLVRMETQRHRLHLAIDVVDAAGASLAHGEGEESIGPWDDAVALARVVARPLVDQVRAAESPPTPTPAAQPPAPVATPAPVVTPRAEPLPTPPIEVVTETSRRPAEAALGAALFVAGGVATGFGLASIVRDGSTVPDVQVENGSQVYVAGARDYVLLGVGGAAAVAGVIVLIDGLRTRTETVSRVRVTGGPGALGLGLRGVF